MQSNTRSDSREHYEQALAIAHKWLWFARTHAAALDMLEVADDLRAMSEVITELGEDSLTGRKKRRVTP